MQQWETTPAVGCRLQGSSLGNHPLQGLAAHSRHHAPRATLRSCKILSGASQHLALLATPRACGNPAVPPSQQLPGTSHILPLSLSSQTQRLSAVVSQNPRHTKSSSQFGQLSARPQAAASAPVVIYRKQNNSNKRNRNKNPARTARSSPSPFTAGQKLSRALTTFTLMD